MARLKRRICSLGGRGISPRSAEDPRSEAPTGFENSLLVHLDALYATALNLTKDQDRAEDLVQEASLKAWRNREQLETTQKVRAWLFKILLNTFINAYRKANREPQIVDVELTEEMLEQADGAGGTNSPDPLDIILRHCLDEEVQQALDQLHTEMRTVVWLSDVEEFRVHEIAEMLGCPAGTVASRLFRGRALLRELLHTYARRHKWIKE